MLPDDLRDFARSGAFAALTTLLPDGHPATQPMWVDADEQFILLNTEIHRRKFDSVQRDPRVTVMLWERDNPYNYREVRGRVVEIVRGPEARRHVDDLAQRYFGRPYDPKQITSERAILRVAPHAR
jgi:PPOX class probable F420-dependent enzyme